MENKLNGFNNGRDTTDGVGGKEPFIIYEHPINDLPNTYVIGIDPYDVPKTLQNKVFEALGEVSMCWSETPKGIFDSTDAERIGNELMKEIDSEIEIYKKIAYELAKSQTGKFLTIDVNMVPNTKYFDKDKFWELVKNQGLIAVSPPKPSIKEAIEVLCNALREDTTEGSYYYSWQANIAMAFQDEFFRECGYGDVSRELLHKISNEAAKNFLNLLINK